MAIPWQVIATAETGEGLLELRQRGEDDFLIVIDGRILMNSRANRSEIVLAELACHALGRKKRPRVLIGGLGMGFTLAAALANLPGQAKVVVAELNPVVVDWCQGPIRHLTSGAVADPRVEVVIDDVATLISHGALGGGEKYDAIILDLYEGPYAQDHLFGESALHLARAALRDNGIYAVWSEDPDKGFEGRLADAGFTFDKQRPGRGGRRHVVYIARPQPVGKGGRQGRKRRRR